MRSINWNLISLHDHGKANIPYKRSRTSIINTSLICHRVRDGEEGFCCITMLMRRTERLCQSRFPSEGTD